MFKQYDVQFISLHENFDTTTAVGRAMLQLILVFAELERGQTVERTRATMGHRAREGLWNGSVQPLGFDLDPNKKGVLTVNAAESRVLQEDFFRKCVELGSAGKVVRHLKTREIREPQYVSRNEQKHGGAHFTKPKVIRLLSNPLYIGKSEYDGQVYPGRQPAIIPDNLFQEVQRVLEGN